MKASSEFRNSIAVGNYFEHKVAKVWAKRTNKTHQKLHCTMSVCVNDDDDDVQ